MKLDRFWPWLCWLVLAVAMGLALLPVPEAQPAPPGADKIGHGLLFAFLYWLAWRSSWGSFAGGSLGLLAGLMGYGLLMECLQFLVGYREFSVADMGANLVGAGLMALWLHCRQALD